MSTTTCPIYRPTTEEFSNFTKYVHEIEKKSDNGVGIIKVIPPPGEGD